MYYKALSFHEELGLNVKRILFFGDSNTWGYDCAKQVRFPYVKTWPFLLEGMLKSLGIPICATVEGLNGRLTDIDDPTWKDRNGMKHLPTILESQDPLDLILIMLGTNDIKYRLKRTPESILAGLKKIILFIKTEIWTLQKSCPKILITCPIGIYNVSRVNYLCKLTTINFAGY